MLRTAEMVKLYCIFHKSYLEEVLAKLQNLGAVQFFDARKKFSFLDVPKQAGRGVKELEKAERFIALIKPEGKPFLLEKIFGPGRVFIAIARGSGEGMLKDAQEKLRSFEEGYSNLQREKEELLRKKAGVEEKINEERKALLREALISSLPESRFEYIKSMKEEEDKISSGFSELEQRIELFERDNYLELLAVREKLQNIMHRARAVADFGAMQHSFVFGCWTPRKNLERVIRALERATDDSSVIAIEEVKAGEEAPTLLQNPWFIKPYEILTESYGVPKYGEVDPTPFLAITFTALFGMMFADAGYGITLSFLSLIVFIKTTKADIFQRNLNLILFYAGSASFVFGLLFGEFFGGLMQVTPLWIEPAGNIELLLMLSIGVGICHVSISILSRLVSNLLGRKSILYPFSLLVVLWSGIFIVALSSHCARYALAFGIALLAAGKGIAAVEELLALCANIVSYSRIAILCVLHVLIARLLVSAVLSLPASFLGIAAGVLLLVSGAALILVSGVFLVFVHSLRLHWLEFFKRFYSGVGERFKPFAAHKEYTYVMR